MEQAPAQAEPVNRRSLRNFVVSPREQIRYSFILVLLCSSVLASMIILLLYQMNQTIYALAIAYRVDHDILEAIQVAMKSAMWVSAGVGILMIVVTALVALKISHKIYGPAVAMKRHVLSLAQGQYDSRLTLRQGDDFLELRDALNQLAESLQKRYTK